MRKGYKIRAKNDGWINFFLFKVISSQFRLAFPALLLLYVRLQGRVFMSKLMLSMQRDEVLPMLPFERAFVSDLLGMVAN